MADITAELEQIRNAVYGEEVRAAFISALVKINEEGGGGSGGGESYTLPQASADALGGVKADEKTNNDTVPAKIGSDGKMYVQKYPTSLPASDVKDWAKENEKPKYTAEEVGALPEDTEIPTKLPNPHKLIFSGAVTGEYDGSSETTIDIPQPSGGGYTLPQSSADALGGVKADPKTEEDTVPARIGEDGKLYVKSYPEGGGNADNGVPAGGSTGQMLVKKSDSDNDVEWKTPLTAAEVAEVVMENYLEIIDDINGEAVYTTDDLETDLDTVNGEVI